MVPSINDLIHTAECFGLTILVVDPKCILIIPRIIPQGVHVAVVANDRLVVAGSPMATGGTDDAAAGDMHLGASCIHFWDQHERVTVHVCM